MRRFGSLMAALCVSGLAVATPPPLGRPPELMTCQMAVSTSSDEAARESWAPPTPSSSSSPEHADCAPGGECDCTRIADKNSEEYFQCVTNPSCERCWVGTSTRTTGRASSRAASSSFSNSTTDFRTAAPGTYTVTASDVVSVIVVPEPPEGTPEPATEEEEESSSSSTSSSSSSSSSSPSPSSSASPRVITVVETTVVTVGPTSVSTTAADSDGPTTASSPADALSSGAGGGAKCAGVCNCARIEDKMSAEYYQCLRDPACEDCRASPAPPPSPGGPPASDPDPRPTRTTGSSATTTTTTTTTTTPAKPKPSCPPYCDCSKIKDKESDEYFQCVTNPNCERCRAGGG